MKLIDDILDFLGVQINKNAKKMYNDTIKSDDLSEKEIKSKIDEFAKSTIKATNKALNDIGIKQSISETENIIISDNITLSQNLYFRLNEVKQAATKTIKKHLKEQKTIKDLSLKIYQGYDFKKDDLDLKKTLPKYLFNEAVNLANKQKNKVKTKNLKTAYNQVLKAKSDEAKAKALKVAMYEKGRFYANRIAQNEVNLEYMREKAKEILNNDDIETIAIKMSKAHPRTDICDYFSSVNLYGLGKGLYPKDKAPLPPFHPFCRCRLIPKFSESAKDAKFNPKAEKEFIKSLASYKQAQILGSKRRAFEYLNSDISLTDFYNQTKSQRYKTKQLSYIYEAIRQNATQTITNLYKSVDFSKSGYRAQLKEPLILTKLSDKIIKILNDLNYKTDGNFQVLTQKDLLHGMRLKKIKDGDALNKDEFLNMSLNFTENNLYIGFDEKNNKSFAFFWGATDKKVNYAYFDIRGDLKTYGITNLQTIKKYKKVISGS